MSLDSTHTMRRGGRDASLCVARGPVFPAVLDSRAQHDSPIPGEGRLEQEAAARYENTLRVVAALEKTVDTTHRELETRLRGAGLALAGGLASCLPGLGLAATLARHVQSIRWWSKL